MSQTTHGHWRKSSRSGTANDACVEVHLTNKAGVRDSKNRDPNLWFGSAAWGALLRKLQ